MTSADGALVVRPLRPTDDRSGFTCGNDDLDRFFRQYAGQNQFKSYIGVTYVAVDRTGRLLGFATVASAEVMAAQLTGKSAKRLPNYPIPALRLARLAVDLRARGLGIGGELLNTVFDLAHGQAATVGCVGVIVDAKQQAIAFYESLGFQAMQATMGALSDRPEPVPMFIWLQDVPKR
jgi:GNAT superfamily N-acetyltransferase